MPTTLPQAILFDADGTLYDSDPLHFAAYQSVAKKLYDFEFTWEVFMNELVHGSKKIDQVLQENGVEVDREILYKHKRQAYQELVKDKLQPLPGLLDFLEWCHQSNISCIIVSAATHQSLETSLDALQIRSFFEHLIGHEDIGDRKKPHPYPYEFGLKRLGLTADQAIAVEDTAKGITSAQGAGLRCVGIRNPSNTQEEVIKADHIITNYQELLTYLL